MPALTVLEAAAAAPSTVPHAPAPRGPQKETICSGTLRALEKAENTPRPDPAQATGATGAAQATDNLAGDSSYS